MGWFTGVVVFLITWWTLLFAVLPFGHKRDKDGTPLEGTNIKRKFVWTTVGAVVVWVMIYLIIDADIISFQSMAQEMFEEDRVR